MNNKKEYDERQLKIRGDVFQRGFIIAFLLLMANALLHTFEITWATPVQESLITAMVLMTIVIAELIIRGVYFGKSDSRTMITVLAFLSGAAAFAQLAAAGLGIILNNRTLLEEGVLSDTGFSLVFGLIWLSFAISSAIRYNLNKKDENS
jgi:NAD/NADP transhydrogenase beta subunit